MHIAIALAGALLLVPRAGAAAQTADSAAVVKVATSVFDAMRTRDTAMLKAAFAPDARLVTAMAGRDGAPRVTTEPVQGFVKALSEPSAEVWDERTYNTEVRIDGNLATVWMEYDFYLGAKFLHCGVDAFQLARHAGGWKIVALADTRRQQGCTRAPRGAGPIIER